MRRVLVIDEDEAARRALQLALRAAGYETEGVASPAEGRRQAARGAFDFVVGREPAVGSEPWGAARLVAVLPAGSGAAAGLGAVRAGAEDFVVDSGASDALAAGIVLAIAKAEARLAAVARAVAVPAAPEEMVGSSPELARLVAALRRVAPYKTTVLVRGESGTGKELVARALHRQSPRAAGPFVAVNCGAIPAGLMESELFGHVRGTFTDALRDHEGLLVQASGGTLFLDEIAELPIELQVKLLRVLEDDRVRRLGDTEDRVVDVRLVAATARDLEAQVAAGRFRADLFHRLDVLSLRLPSLRDRSGDVPQLAAHFLATVNRRLGLALGGIAPDAMRILTAYPWPGNIRELENTIERAAVMADGSEIDVASLPERILEWSGRARRPGGNGASAGAPATAAGAGAHVDDGGDLSIKRASRRGEEELIRKALARTAGNRTKAAELLEISHRTLLYKIKEYGM